LQPKKGIKFAAVNVWHKPKHKQVHCVHPSLLLTCEHLRDFLQILTKVGAAPEKKPKINQTNGEECNSWFELKTATPYRAEQLLDTSYLSYEESPCSDSTK
jgi:hypothetical protein